MIIFISDKRRSSDSSRTTESSTSSKNEDSNSSQPTPSGVNRRTAVLFSKKGKGNRQDDSRPSSPVTPSATPPRKGRKPKHHVENAPSPQPPTLEPVSPPSKSTRGPGSPAARKRSASAISSPERDGKPSPPKRTTSLTEPLHPFSDPPDITNRDSFMVYRGPDNLHSSSESDSTSVISSSDDSLSDDSTGSSSSRSGRNNHLMFKSPFRSA